MTTIGANISYLDTTALLSNPKSVAPESKKSGNEAKIAEVAEDFEAFFMTKMMETMFEGVSTDGMFGGGNAEKVFRSMLFDEYGKAMAKTGNIGVKDDIMRSILQMQEMDSNGFIEG